MHARLRTSRSGVGGFHFFSAFSQQYWRLLGQSSARISNLVIKPFHTRILQSITNKTKIIFYEDTNPPSGSSNITHNSSRRERPDDPLRQHLRQLVAVRQSLHHLGQRYGAWRPDAHDSARSHRVDWAGHFHHRQRGDFGGGNIPVAHHVSSTH